MGFREDLCCWEGFICTKCTQNAPKNASPGRATAPWQSNAAVQEDKGKNAIKFQYPLEIPGAITEAGKDYLGSWEVAGDPRWQCHAILIIISGPDLHGWKKLLLL